MQLDETGIVLAVTTPHGESRCRVDFAVADRRGEAGPRLTFRRLVSRAKAAAAKTS